MEPDCNTYWLGTGQSNVVTVISESLLIIHFVRWTMPKRVPHWLPEETAAVSYDSMRKQNLPLHCGCSTLRMLRKILKQGDPGDTFYLESCQKTIDDNRIAECSHRVARVWLIVLQKLQHWVGGTITQRFYLILDWHLSVSENHPCQNDQFVKQTECFAC